MEIFKSVLKAIGLGIFYILSFQVLNFLILLPLLFVASRYYGSIEEYSLDYNIYFAIIAIFTIVVTPLIYWKFFLTKLDFVKGEKNKKLVRTFLIVGAILLFLFNVRLIQNRF